VTAVAAALAPGEEEVVTTNDISRSVDEVKMHRVDAPEDPTGLRSDDEQMEVSADCGHVIISYPAKLSADSIAGHRTLL
jgi:hypothetical protein